MVEKPKTKYRINIAMSIFWIVFAGIFDLFTLIPFVGDAASPIFWTIFGVYSYKKGMQILNGRKLAVTAISFVAELIPVIQELPMLVAGIIGVLLIIRIEDKTGMNIIKPINAGVTPPRYKKIPVNTEKGVRSPGKGTRSEDSDDFPLNEGQLV